MALLEFLILRKPRSGCLEGRTALIQQAVDSFTRSEAGTYVRNGHRPQPVLAPAEGGTRGPVCKLEIGRRAIRPDPSSGRQAMRVTIKFAIPIDAGNEGNRTGKLQKVFQQLAEDLKPEAAYFHAVDGDRGWLLHRQHAGLIADRRHRRAAVLWPERQN